MMQNKTLIITEVVLLILIILGTVAIFMVDLDLGIFKIVKFQSLISYVDKINDAEIELDKIKSEYDTAKKQLDNTKKTYETEKMKYDAITDDTINIIKEATTSEKYNIEYMWIKLGNYARANNLKLTMLEPGATAAPTEKTENIGSTGTNTGTTNDTTNSNAKTQETGKDATGATANPTADGTTTPPTTTPNTTAPSSGNELTIKVVGNYLNISDFIFDIENDRELRFKLDKIKMEPSGGTNISASFAVKNLVFIK